MSRDVRDLLSRKKSALLERWFDIVLETYPSESSGFLKNKKRQFANPVGYTISQGLEDLLDELLQEREMDIEKVSSVLDSIIRIRAVQDVTPSQALAFVFRLKKVLREEGGTAPSEEIEALESRIDAIALISFDLFMKCREKIYDLKANELRNMTFRLLQKAKLVCEIPGE
ncbi:MAG: RsbRD N-terminal domain-containing protein [Nitrospirae bacterium]|nr:RsbRD N-terminal domain-containing protein [Nitrospirota bacterium]MCL5421503.1 RsbRD N-terminal domain-containing protein [Nitrospirota bacterium]